MGDRAAVLGLAFQFEQTQWWAPERLRRHQFAQLAILVRHAGDTAPFWRQRFERWGFDHRAPLNETTWKRLPILTRSELQGSGKVLRSEAPPTAHGECFTNLTSGSTGTPVEAYRTGLQGLMWRANMVRDHLWHRRDFSGRFATIKNFDRFGEAPYPAGETGWNWGVATTAFETGPSFKLALSTTIDKQAKWLSRVRPDYVLSYPSNFEALAHFYRDTKLKPPRFRQFQSISEVLRPEVRAVCHDVFGVAITEKYSTEEIGYIALQAPNSEELLVQAETTLVEILDDQGRDCAPGEVGRVVVTPLHAFAMPLLRYAVGDLAEAGGPASCGRGLPMIRRVIGRERHMVRLPDGRSFYPSYVGLMGGFHEVRQFQIVRIAETVLELRLVAAVPLAEDRLDLLKERIIERFQFPFEVVVVYLDAIPRERSGKFLDFKTEVG